MKSLLLFLRKKILKPDDRSQLEIAVDNGLTLGKNVHVMGECILDPGHCWLISIGDHVTLSPRVHILAHDASTKKELGYTKISKVEIGNHVFVGANTVILPGVHIGDRVIIGAGSVVTKDIPENSVAAGNPAVIIGTYSDYMERNKEKMKDSPIFDESYMIGNITNDKKEEMNNLLEDGIGYIR